MASLTELVAAVVVHSSAAAFSHFGVTLEAREPRQSVPAVVEQTVARSPRAESNRAAPCSETRVKLRPLRA
jgi:hypothetical protein